MAYYQKLGGLQTNGGLCSHCHRSPPWLCCHKLERDNKGSRVRLLSAVETTTRKAIKKINSFNSFIVIQDFLTLQSSCQTTNRCRIKSKQFRRVWIQRCQCNNQSKGGSLLLDIYQEQCGEFRIADVSFRLG